MRQSVRLLARYLEVGSPTGLTGLRAHRTPRYALLNTYQETLDRLRQLPETSLYRQSAEAVARHRLSVAERLVPPGFEAWQAQVEKALQGKPADAMLVFPEPEVDEREQEWDGDVERLEGKEAVLRERIERALHNTTHKLAIATAALKPFARSEFDAYVAEAKKKAADVGKDMDMTEDELLHEFHTRHKPDEVPEKVTVKVEYPPDLTEEQIAEFENTVGAGLIEEVLQVAEGELKLVDIMTKNQVWEPLEEKPKLGQWEYFERKSA